MSFNIPSFVNSKVIDENGYFTSEWALVMSILLPQLQLNLNPEGLQTPALTSAQIGFLTDASRSNGRIVQNSDTGLPEFNVNGTWMTFTLT